MTPEELVSAPHYVYRLYDKGARLLYIGCSYNPRKRMHEHRRARWFKDVASTDITAYPDATSGYRAEAEAHANEGAVHSKNASAPLRWIERLADKRERAAS